MATDPFVTIISETVAETIRNRITYIYRPGYSTYGRNRPQDGRRKDGSATRAFRPSASEPPFCTAPVISGRGYRRGTIWQLIAETTYKRKKNVYNYLKGLLFIITITFREKWKAGGGSYGSRDGVGVGDGSGSNNGGKYYVYIALT